MNLISFDGILAENFQYEFLVGNLSVEILKVFICNKLDFVFVFFNDVVYSLDIIGGVYEIIQTKMSLSNNKNKVVFTLTDMMYSILFL